MQKRFRLLIQSYKVTQTVSLRRCSRSCKRSSSSYSQGHSSARAASLSCRCFLDSGRGVPVCPSIYTLPPLIRRAFHSCHCDYIWSDGPWRRGQWGGTRRAEEGQRHHSCPLHAAARSARKYTRDFFLHSLFLIMRISAANSVRCQRGPSYEVMLIYVRTSVGVCSV